MERNYQVEAEELYVIRNRLQTERDLYRGVLRTFAKGDLFEVSVPARDYARAALDDGAEIQKGIVPCYSHGS